MNIPLENQAAPQMALMPHADVGTIRAFQLRYARSWMSACLVAADVTGVVLAAMLAFWLHYRLLGGAGTQQFLQLLPLAGAFVAVFAFRQLYPAIGLGAVEEFRRLTINTSLVFLALALSAFASKAGPTYSRFVYFATWIFALAFIPSARQIVRLLLTRLKLWGTPVVMIGAPEYVQQIGGMLKANPRIGLDPIMPCATGTCPAQLGKAALSLPNHGYAVRCAKCPGSQASMALVIYRDYTELDAVREKYTDTFQRVILVNARDNGLGLSSAAVREFGGLAGLEIRQNLVDRWTQAEKRLIDVFVSAIGILLLLPFFLITAALIYVDSPGRIFYRQIRMGKGGRQFNLLKLRTMHLNADQVLQDTLARDPTLKAEWDQYQKLQRDPRITRVGSFLRRFSIDELPQLWNVFTGDMSLVGPRPMMINQVEMYGKPYEHYVRVVPGITGLWQVSGRNKTTFAQRAELDVKYVMNWSIWLDLYILVRTAWVVLVRDGAA